MGQRKWKWQAHGLVILHKVPGQRAAAVVVLWLQGFPGGGVKFEVTLTLLLVVAMDGAGGLGGHALLVIIVSIRGGEITVTVVSVWR